MSTVKLFDKPRAPREMAVEYVGRVGRDEAQRSNHYQTAKRHCTCGECFCCWVKRLVDASILAGPEDRP